MHTPITDYDHKPLPSNSKTPTDEHDSPHTSDSDTQPEIASKSDTASRGEALYKSIDFYMRMPTMVKNLPTQVGVNLVNTDGREFDADGPLPDGIFASEGALTETWQEDSGMVDLGVSHLVMNDCKLLISFTVLQKPILLGVVTKAPTSYITTKGTIMLPADEGLGLVLKEVNGTLISLVGLIEAGADVSFDGPDLLI
ncbi:hypothetical protein CROQUDRAFT_110033 [Cronartium quercuum f. sp. fusiforme G11]|uniref:Uncharacterized protein n=1 Tax=Cronartium quercuum f. sp. fusiforme G11 TaxID=708437 RepID=A0A9P6N8Z0_9BASI|nr:hypothetical protein CROQUDRAFT_110033 [Cronartium quercuum f. sp. fusiforme G11]